MTVVTYCKLIARVTGDISRVSTPRWEKQSRQGVHVGMSEKHAGNVPLILNFETGNITAQWNAVFDDWFSSVATNVEDVPDFHTDKWSKMFGTRTFNTQPDNKIKESDQQPTQPTRQDIEDNSIDKEEMLQQWMQASNPLTQPNQPTMPPTRMHSQVMSECIKQQSKSPTQELRLSLRTSQQRIIEENDMDLELDHCQV